MSTRLDAKARDLLIYSVLKHSLKTQTRTDEEIKELVHACVDGYEALSEFRQWQLGPKEQLTGATYQFKITEFIISSLVSHLQEHELIEKYDSLVVRAKRQWNAANHKKWDCVWLAPYDFSWVK